MDFAASQREKMRQNGGFLFSRAVGISMRPLIWAGAHWVAVEPLDGEPQLGDMLMFGHIIDGKEACVMHRLVKIAGEGDGRRYVTRGDNSLNCEEVRRRDIIGRVAEVHRMTGYRPWHALAKKKIKVTDRAYRRYVRFWMAIWPVRRLYYRMRVSLGALVRKLGIKKSKGK